MWAQGAGASAPDWMSREAQGNWVSYYEGRKWQVR